MPAFYRYRWPLAVIGSVLFIYLIAFSRMPKSVFWGTDEGAKFIQLQTLLGWQGGAKYQVPYLGQRLDPTYRFYPQHGVYPQPMANGQVYFPWSIGFPLISIIPFKLLGIPGLYVIPLVSGILTAVLSGWLTYRLIPAAAPLTMVAVGLASPIFFFSFLFWEHTLVVLIGLAALWQAMRLAEAQARGKWLSLIFAGLLLANAIALRLEMLAYALALVLAGGFALIVHHWPLFTGQAIFRQWRRWLVTIVIVIMMVGLLTSANFWSFLMETGLIKPSYLGVIENSLDLASNPDTWINLLPLLPQIWINNTHFIGPEISIELVWLGLAGVILAGLAIVMPARVRVWLLGGSGLLIGWVSVYVLFLPSRYRTVHGFFLAAPHLVFMFLFVLYARRERRFAVTLLAATAILYLFFGSIAILLRESRIENLDWGTRYLLMMYPLASICTVVGLYHFYQTTASNWSRRLLWGLAGLLLCLGIGYELRGLQEIQTTKKDFLRYAQALEVIDLPIVTDQSWLPALLATHFVNEEMYILTQQEDLYAWLEMAGDEVDSFVFASIFLLNPNFIEMAPYPLVPGRSQLVGRVTFTEFKIVHTETPP